MSVVPFPKLQIFFIYSPKRQYFFEHITESLLSKDKKMKLKDLCRTCWVQRIDSYLVLYDLYLAINKTMESISTCSSEHSDWSWDLETLTKVNGFCHQLISFEFLVTFRVTMRILKSLQCLTITMQKKPNSIIAAYEHVPGVQLELELLRSNCEEEFHIWFSEIKTLADDLNVPVSTPRITSKQVHRVTGPTDSPEIYYRNNITIPFLDHITTKLRARFGPIHKTKIKLLGLIPAVDATCYFASIKDVGELYKTDLLSSQLLSTEINWSKIKCTATPLDTRPTTLQEALQSCDDDAFPNIYILLVIACTLSVTTCETVR